MRMQIVTVLTLGAVLMLGGACRRDKSTDEELTAKAAVNEPEAWKKKQAAFADSVLQSAPNAKKVVDKLGAKYEVGSTTLRDSVSALAHDAKADCFGRGKLVDPFLAGTVTFWVNMSVVGSDVIRVQESKWTTPAGDVVDGCLGELVKGWKFSTALGAPNAYIVQVQFR